MESAVLPTFKLRLKTDAVIELPKPAVMGVINCSPNSFYNPITDLSDALDQVEAMVEAGASIIDVGGEATNPFVDLDQDSPDVEHEIERVAPVVEAIKSRFDILVSVDTSQPEVMRAAIEKGVDLINDQRAFRIPGALEVVANARVPVCLMHFFHPIREPGSTQLEEMFKAIKSDLTTAVDACLKAGLAQDQIIIDPGFGGGNFGKNTDENYYLLSRLNDFAAMGYPVLSGWSRKSMIGDTLGGVSADQRLYGSIAAATLSALMGASIIRVHDVKETREAIDVIRYFQQFKSIQ